MFSELELAVIEDHNVKGFYAGLMGLRGILASVRNAVDKSEGISPEHLITFYEKLMRFSTEFDRVYLQRIKSAPVNPLEPERQAWLLLSPIIGEYLGRYKRFLDGGKQAEVYEEESIQYLTEGMDLVRKWMIIGDLYKVKLDIVASDKLPGFLEARGIPIEDALPDYNHTHEVWLDERYQEISSRQEDLQRLIQELSKPSKPPLNPRA
ncbi:hypothetical protein HYU14_04890 [Candidatus Woesearchaeota archaeon]|nr:hypothetical protein [Candidatus Woesearchaeota archaeon]